MTITKEEHQRFNFQLEKAAEQYPTLVVIFEYLLKQIDELQDEIDELKNADVNWDEE